MPYFSNSDTDFMLIGKIRDSINSYLDLSEKLNDYWYWEIHDEKIQIIMRNAFLSIELAFGNLFKNVIRNIDGLDGQAHHIGKKIATDILKEFEEKWSGVTESNCRLNLGKIPYYHYTNTAETPFGVGPAILSSGDSFCARSVNHYFN